MPLNIIRNDITRVSADAIVNTANPLVAVGAGVDQAIYEAAGMEQLLAERAKIGPMKPGQAAVTPAFGLDAKYIIHTVGPAWAGGSHGEREAVASCYRESLRLAAELRCESVAFPLISTGTYGFPKDEALKIAISEISAFLFTHDMTVTMVVYSREAFVISSKAFDGVRSFIGDEEIREPSYSMAKEQRRRAFADHLILNRKEKRRDEDFVGSAVFSAPVLSESMAEPDLMEPDLMDLDGMLDQEAETFQQMLFRLIDRKGWSDPEVYKRANIDRKHFSKIRSNVNYVPSKKTALALAVALELNLDETIDLLRRAGLALSPSSRFDLIVQYCIQHQIYNVIEINTYLFDYDQPLLVG